MTDPGHSSNEFEQFAAEFEPEFPPVRDPLVQEVFDLASYHQRELDLTPSASEGMRLSIQQDLDARWPHLKRTVLVSGIVRSQEFMLQTPDEESNGGNPILTARVNDVGQTAMRDYAIDDHILLSHGFVLDDEPYVIGDEEVGTHYLIKLLFQGSLQVISQEGSEMWANVNSYADPESVTILSSIASTDFIRSRSHAYFPHTAKQLEAIESAGKHISTAECLQRLKAIRFTYTRNSWQRQELEILKQYVKRVANVEADPMPMIIDVSPGTRFFEDPFDAYGMTTTPDRTIVGQFSGGRELVLVSQVNLLSRVPYGTPVPPAPPTTRSREKLGVALSIRLLGRQPDQDMQGMIFLHDLLDLHDTRGMFLPPQPTEDPF